MKDFPTGRPLHDDGCTCPLCGTSDTSVDPSVEQLIQTPMDPPSLVLNPGSRTIERNPLCPDCHDPIMGVRTEHTRRFVCGCDTNWRFTFDGPQAVETTDADDSDDPRTPTHCPHCGHDGQFDSKGSFTRELATWRLEGGGSVDKLQRWSHIHCPDCGNEFAMFDEIFGKAREGENGGGDDD